MALFDRIREYTARRALERKFYSEMSHISEAEMNDLGLSRTKIAEMCRQQARAIV